MILHSNLFEMKSQILLTCLQGNYRDSLGELSNASYGVFGAEKVKTPEQRTQLKLFTIRTLMIEKRGLITGRRY